MLSSNEKIIKRITNLKEEGKVAIDAGHYSPRLSRSSIKKNLKLNLPVLVLSSQIIQRDSEEKIDHSDKTFLITNNKEKTDTWIYYKNCDDLVESSLEYKNYWQFTLPSKTEKQTILNAMECYHALIERGVSTEIFMLLGDVWVKPELRNLCQKFVQTYFLSNLDDGHHIKIIRETTCKNKGDERITDKWGKVETQSERQLKLFKLTGGTISKDPNLNSSTLFFTSESLLNDNFLDHHAIALTKQNKPSCAVTLAGKFIIFERAGFTQSISFHDLSDDPLIEQKVIDGALLAIHFGAQKMRDYQVQIYDRNFFTNENLIQGKNYDLEPHDMSLEGLLDKAFLRSAGFTEEYIDDALSLSCCPLIKRKK